MNVHWEHKKQRSRRHEQPARSTTGTSWRWRNGALGGKLIGAGGGGFLMFYAEDKTRLRHAHARGGLARGAVPLRLRGHQVVVQS